MDKLKKNLVLASILATSSIISGCNDEAITYNDSKISYINALDEQATFFIKQDGASGKIYNNKHRVISLLKETASGEIKHTWFGFKQSQIAVEDTNTRSNYTSIKKTLRDKRNYWTVAWLDNNDYELSIFEKETSNMDGLYRVRVFSNGQYPIYINGNTTNTLFTKKGEVSDFFSVEKCTELKIANNNIDLCKGDFGKSYLAVVDENGLLSLTEEI
ncbi:hypothetical protein ACM9HF_03120 [Colwellia sp. RE-S-Sl-9]